MLQKAKDEKQRIDNIYIPDEILFEEIIMRMDSPDFIKMCKTNKRFQSICNDKTFWKRMYEKHYGDSDIKNVLPDLTYFELFKTCYYLNIIQKTFSNGIALKDLYHSKLININGGANSKFLIALSYMYHLEEINFYIKNLNNPIIIPKEVNALPFLKKVFYHKV